MTPDTGSRRREIHTAWFIAALMFSALVYFVSQGGLIQQFLPDEAANETVFDADQQQDRLKRLERYRRSIALPLSATSTENDSLAHAFARLRQIGINWVELRVPLWTATARRLEYSAFELDEITRIIDLAHSYQCGVTIAPMYWDGEFLSTAPRVDVSSGLYASYRDMLLDLTRATASAGADALLLDDLFGAAGVSATEWVTLLDELRSEFGGSLELRTDEQSTPSPYLRQLDAAHIPADTALYYHIRESEPGVRLLLRSVDSDRYTSEMDRWNPVLRDFSADEHALFETITLAKKLDSLGGFVLSGEHVYSVSTSGAVNGSGFLRKLRELIELQFNRELEENRQQLRAGP